ncbi:hypothetical protein [Iningainema tapete]|uniref:Uncharacterized protein n=1 Tax=Iningainema tapete BLCC-T55 TaxID=2748662 RepID=A0A8J7C9V3_9CYAN|nr:hypothetical protein [Iningainema tapete]MBD2771180.1 hypothetical protein [Iningainema tapete BLCC-T55]
MPAGTFTNEWISQSARILYLGESPPDPNSFWLCLANTALLTRASSTTDFVAAEPAAEHGYTRANIVFTAGAYDTTDQRYEIPIATATFTATDASLNFQTAFLMASAQPTPQDASGVAIAYFVESAPVTVPPGQSYTYQIPYAMLNTGYVNGI